ncbi:hypothetical protein ARALYDRAFT_896333 [Arabidopsis lyrata subsp. lyrata]|uniref:Cationic amino acid transporter C-terminal domain-containing protein n=1 Tax=Arabidopsis lyrata subsp. lyrata TaxID=81972 RepID=D7L0G2_ARALL|nr:hypothetical protein ARALYDRAFT_896333 [Arabidopsis lyrata subsp. lyrata]
METDKRLSLAGKTKQLGGTRGIGAGTWIRVLVWLLIGSMIYLFYGRSHSLLNNAVYTTCTRKTTDHLA